MKQKLINILMIIEPFLSIIIYIALLFLGQMFYLRIFDSIVSFNLSDIYIRLLKHTTLIILFGSLIISIIKRKKLKLRYFFYAFLCIIQLYVAMVIQYEFASYEAYDTSIGTVGIFVNQFARNREIEYYYIYENNEMIDICRRDKEYTNTIPEDKIINNDGIIEYNYYDGRNKIILTFEFEIELTYEEKLEYINVFVNEVYSYDEKNLLD